MEILEADYLGSGTEKDPYIVDFLPGDKSNPQLWPAAYKWTLTALVAVATLAVGFSSSAYSGAAGGAGWGPFHVPCNTGSREVLHCTNDSDSALHHISPVIRLRTLPCYPRARHAAAPAPPAFHPTLTRLPSAFPAPHPTVGILEDFDVSYIIVVLGISLFVLGFALGPLIWAPFSEVLGRRPLFIYTYIALTAFSAGCALAPNMTALIVLRFFAGAFGSSPLTNAGGTISDLFNANQRGLAMSMFAAAPFMGPVIGPIVGGFTGMTVGWRWVMWVMCIFSGAVLVIGSLFLPETYAPVLLRKRAAKLSQMTGKVCQ